MSHDAREQHKQNVARAMSHADTPAGRASAFLDLQQAASKAVLKKVAAMTDPEEIKAYLQGEFDHLASNLHDVKLGIEHGVPASDVK